MAIITGPPNGPVLFCSLASVVCRRRLSSSVTIPAAGRVGGRAAVGSVTVTSSWRHLVVIIIIIISNE